MAGIVRTLIGVEIIRERWMALLITWSVAHACALKGFQYQAEYPGWFGWFVCGLSPLTAVVVGINLLALTKHSEREPIA